MLELIINYLIRFELFEVNQHDLKYLLRKVYLLSAEKNELKKKVNENNEKTQKSVRSSRPSRISREWAFLLWQARQTASQADCLQISKRSVWINQKNSSRRARTVARWECRFRKQNTKIERRSSKGNAVGSVVVVVRALCMNRYSWVSCSMRWTLEPFDSMLLCGSRPGTFDWVLVRTSGDVRLFGCRTSGLISGQVRCSQVVRTSCRSSHRTLTKVPLSEHKSPGGEPSD